MTVLLPSSVAHSNILLLVAVVPAATIFYALRHPWWLTSGGGGGRSGGHRVPVLWALVVATAVLTSLGAALELYHWRSCPNSQIFQDEIATLARFVLSFCDRQSLPFWVSFGNLLFVLRNETRIPVGDTDSDIAIDKRWVIDQFQTVDNLTQVMLQDAERHLTQPVYATYLRDRELLQIYWNADLKGAHADIWFYLEERNVGTGEHWLVNYDRTIRAQKLPYDAVLPLSTARPEFLGVPVSLPRDPHYLARAEYGSSYMTPLVTRLECMENVWNGYCFYKTDLLIYGKFALFLISTAVLTVTAVRCIPSLAAELMGGPWSRSSRLFQVLAGGRRDERIREKDWA